MSATTVISNDGVSIRIERSGNNRMILKSHIKEISILKNTVLHFDLGEDRRIFIPYADILSPVFGNPNGLLSNLTNWVGSVETARHIEITGKFDTLAANIQQGGSSGSGSALVLKYVDERNPNCMYYGYCGIVETQEDGDPLSIERVITETDIVTHSWADGQRLGFTHEWADRETLNYQ